MGFSNRDGKIQTSILSSQSGQGIIEYILVVCVGVAIIMGGIWKLNQGFKAWGEKYFGNYIACLLETGELPIISGGGGGGGICDSEFAPFTFELGRPPLSKPGTSRTPTAVTSRGTDDGPSGSGGGGRETKSTPSGRPAQSSGPGGTSFSKFVSKSDSGGKTKISSMKADEVKTGDTSVSKYGSQFGYQARKLDTRTKNRMSLGAYMQKDKEEKEKMNVTGMGSGQKGNGAKKKRLLLNGKAYKAAPLPDDGQPMDFGDYLRYLIIAAIIIALVLFVGGQLMQINESME